MTYAGSRGVLNSSHSRVTSPSKQVRTRGHLRSASSSSLIVRRTRLSTVSDRSFPVAAACIWNDLSRYVTSRHVCTVPSSFLSHLKTRLYSCSFSNLLYRVLVKSLESLSDTKNLRIIIVIYKAGTHRQLLANVKARKMTYFGHILNKNDVCLEKDLIQGTLPGGRRKGKPRTSWIVNLTSWTTMNMDEMLRSIYRRQNRMATVSA